MGNGSSSNNNSAEATRRRQALQETERRRAEQRLREQQQRDRQVSAAAASNASNMSMSNYPARPGAGGSGGYPGAHTQVRMQEQQQQQAMLQLQHIMRHMTSGGRGFQQAPAVQAVTEGRTISNECAVNTYSLKFDKASSRLEFTVINNVPCEVEVHVAVRLDVYQGIVFSTPNRQRAPPRRVAIDEPHEEGVPLSFVLDERYEDIPAAERAYHMQQPKAFPVVISVLYQHDPNNTPNADATRARKAAALRETEQSPHVSDPRDALEAKKATQTKAAEFNETEARQKIHARRAEHTCLALDPQLKMVKQLFELEGGTYLVEHLFGGEQEARVVSEESAEAQEVGVAAGEGSACAGAVVTGGSQLIDADGDDDSTCVICLTDERDTAVMPCRHLCLCRGCADELRKHTPKCPVCRGPIQQLLSMKKKK